MLIRTLSLYVSARCSRHPSLPGGALARLNVLYLAIGAGVGSLLPFLVVYLTWRGLSPAEAGFVLGLMSAVGVAALPLWGLLADRLLGSVRALQLSCLLAALASLALFGAGSSVVAIVCCAAVLAAARAPGEALSDALAVGTLGEAAPQHYGSVRLWASVGFAVAVGVWGTVLDHTSLALMLFAYPVALLVVIASTRGMGSRPLRTARVPWRRAARELVSGRFALVLAGAFGFGVAIGASTTLLPLAIVDAGGDVGTVGAASVVGAVGEVPLMLSSGLLARRFGPASAFLAGGVLFAVAVGLYGLIDVPAGLVAVSAIRGAGYALVYVGLVTAIGGLLSTDRQASGQAALQTTMMGIAPIAGASLGGVAYTELSPALVFGTAGALAALGSVVSCVGASPRVGHDAGLARSCKR